MSVFITQETIDNEKDPNKKALMQKMFDSLDDSTEDKEKAYSNLTHLLNDFSTKCAERREAFRASLDEKDFEAFSRLENIVDDLLEAAEDPMVRLFRAKD